ncbi:hypothetical protein K490DRAFT_74836 [Saccharata proteae CBS 121410]|uniref:F-box domain-containing protein n=1 Tax=Saccharata proteae CBS 121410 TaxID=1314787 RepID=A0A9P4HU07_9PEZI|nr:hypothetical protein K490DRAFT_74836 [Saccharata proteae CBS 121410]
MQETGSSKKTSSVKTSKTSTSGRRRLQKKPPPSYVSQPERQGQSFPAGKPGNGYLNTEDAVLDKHTGERRDVTEMLHALAHRESFDSLDAQAAARREEQDRPPGEPLIASLSSEIWDQIVSHLTLSDSANLAFTSKTLLSLVGRGPWHALNLETNRLSRIDFLVSMDRHLPDHLFCFACARYHLRTHKGDERLRPTNVLNPLFTCPNQYNAALAPARTRLVPHYTLPFTFVQLVTRARRYSPAHGIPITTLSRRWRDRDSNWTHQTRFQFDSHNHLLMRVVSQTFAPSGLPPAGLRHLLYSMEDYTPYFSVCAHWRDGDLMNIAKCALSHIPKPKESVAQQVRKGPDAVGGIVAARMQSAKSSAIVTLCSTCKPLRRCPDCPSEYLVELKLAEDKTEQNPYQRFKHAIVVTRWCDLGDGSSPGVAEWAAVNGETETGVYDSFETVGKRAISGVFESDCSDNMTIPGMRVLSLNPKKVRKGEEGHNWY